MKIDPEKKIREIVIILKNVDQNMYVVVALQKLFLFMNLKNKFVKINSRP